MSEQSQVPEAGPIIDSIKKAIADAIQAIDWSAVMQLLLAKLLKPKA